MTENTSDLLLNSNLVGAEDAFKRSALSRDDDVISSPALGSSLT